MKGAVCVSVAVLIWTSPALCEPVTGNWTGAIDGHTITLVHIEAGADGKLFGTFSNHETPLDAPDFHAQKTTIADVVVTNDHLSFSVPGAGGEFDGTWDAAKVSWIGTFQWGKKGYKSTLDLTRTDLTSLPLAAHPVVYASPADETRALNDLVQTWADDGRFMGSVLVMQDGKILLDKGFGMADVSKGLPNTPDTAYHIGSITKQFTAAAILLLQDRGKLKISDPISTYLPDAPAAWDQITLIDLLTHTSGLGDDGDDFTGRWAQDETPAQLWAVIRNEPLKFRPGTQFSYSNTGYAVLGLVIEKVSGRSYGDFLRDNLFKPLGMTATAYNPPFSPIQAHGYIGSVDGPVPTHNPLALSLAFAAGGIVSTTHDMALWQTKLLGGQVLAAAALKQMTTPFKNNYGFGLEIADRDGHLDFGHDGQVPGFHTSAHYQPDNRLNVVVFGNLDTWAPVILRNSLVSVARGLPGRLPPKPYVVLPAVLASYAGTYELSPNSRVVFTYENGKLTAQVPAAPDRDAPRVEVFASSESHFFSKSWEVATFEFVKTDDGTVSVVLHHLDGMPDEVGKRQAASQ
jgi:CubicO group peptidase (beta-lactamase class C family)